MTRSNPRPIMVPFVIAVWLAGMAGCSSDSTPACRPEVPAGRIQGRVMTGGVAADAVVSATRIPDESLAMAIHEVEPDSSGSYTLDVPAGRYVVSLRVGSYRTVYDYSASGLRFGQMTGDTLLVDDAVSPLTIDFPLSSLRLHLDLPHHVDSLSATVQLWRRDSPPSGVWRTYVDRAATTVQDGVADVILAGVLPGSYRVEVILGRVEYWCDCPWDGEHIWIPGMRDSTASPWIEIPADRIVDAYGQIDTEPARIEGDILGAWLDLGLDPPALALFTPDSTVVRGFRVVGGLGHFSVDMLLPGPVKLLVDHDGVRRWIGGETFETAQVFTLENGHTISGVRLVESAMLVDFSPSELSPGQPSLYVYDRTNMSVVAAIVLPMPEGRIFAVPNLSAGAFLLRIEPYSSGSSSWAPQWYDRASRAEDAKVISIESDGDIVRVPVVLEPQRRI